MVTSVLGGGVEFIMIYFCDRFTSFRFTPLTFFCIDYINENALFLLGKSGK